MFCLCRKSPAFLIAAAFLTACGGGGGSGDPKPVGVKTIAEVDADHDGLIEIATLEQLDWIRNDPAGKTLADSFHQSSSTGCPASGCFGYELVADLDFDTNGDGRMDAGDTYFDHDKNGSNAGWKPILRFSATFEGNGHHIKNLYINRPEELDGVGLFGLVIGAAGGTAAIRNLYLDGGSITGAYEVGALVGNLTGEGTFSVTNIHRTGNIYGKTYVGGIIGSAFTAPDRVLIDSNSVSGVVEAKFGVAGGFIAIANLGNGTVTFSNNSASTSVSGETVGGLVGSFSSGDAVARIEKNASAGSVISTGWAGGLFGSVSGANVVFRDNYSTASVVAKVGAGGLIESLAVTGASISNVHASGSVSGDGNVGGLIGEMTCSDGIFIEGSYASGDVTGFYEQLHEGTSYRITGGFAGGLIAVVHAPANGSCGVRRSYASGNVIGGQAGGGLIGSVDAEDNTWWPYSEALVGALVISGSISMGAVEGGWRAGGLIGNLYYVRGEASFVAQQNLVLGAIIADPKGVFGGRGGAALAGQVTLNTGSTATFAFNHWASDTTATSIEIGVTSPSVTQTGNLSATRTELECTVGANDFACAGGELFHAWDASTNLLSQPAWDFGDAAELPGLLMGNAIHRPVYDGSHYSFAIQNL